MSKFQSIIINLLEDHERIKEVELNIKQKIINKLNDNGTFWFITQNSIKNKELIFNSFNIIEKFNEYFLKNIIIVPNFQSKKQSIVFADNISHVVFFAKNTKYYFDKDPIREKHIWKDVEWGKRKKNYNAKGKDPGNVWLKTIDDGKANITNHVTLDMNEVIERIIQVSCKKNKKILMLNCKKIKFNNFERIIEHEKL